MGLTMKQRQAVTRQVSKRYKDARRKEKGLILCEFVALTGYNRSYAACVLRRGVGRRRPPSGRAGGRQRTYDDRVFKALKKIWAIMDFICGKRLAPYMGELVPHLIRHGELRIAEETRRKLIRISPATIDRLLAPERKKQQLRGRSGTKPGTLLKHQIPVRTHTEWNEQRPGFTEIDLVGHDGGDSRGEFAQTLDVTDICTGWTETEAVRNKAQKWVFAAFRNIRWRLPFDMHGIDSDNGSEFINYHLLRYCKKNKITFTRGRAYRKNDNCYVEQKNYSVVRRTVGYLRHDTPEELKVLNELYGYLRLYTNFFQPVMKLKEKTRVGSRVRKRYDEAKTPLQRVLASSEVSPKKKRELRAMHKHLNPAELKRQITRLQHQLLELATKKKKTILDRDNTKKQSRFEYILGEATIHHFK